MSSNASEDGEDSGAMSRAAYRGRAISDIRDRPPENEFFSSHRGWSVHGTPKSCHWNSLKDVGRAGFVEHRPADHPSRKMVRTTSSSMSDIYIAREGVSTCLPSRFILDHPSRTFPASPTSPPHPPLLPPPPPPAPLRHPYTPLLAQPTWDKKGALAMSTHGVMKVIRELLATEKTYVRTMRITLRRAFSPPG